MTHDERAHIERLLRIHRASLRELEAQAATFGDLHVPVHVKHQIAEHQGKLAELEAHMAELLPLHNLPPRDYERFIGRQKELAEVRRLLLPYPKSRYHLVTIDGIGGIGKSALALEAAYAYCEGYVDLPETERFDAVVWVSAKRSYLTADGILERRQAFRTLDDLYAAIAQVLDFPAITRARAEEQRAIVEQVLGEQRTLLILDNLETVDDEDLLVFLRELPDPTKAIVTTRHRIDVAHPVRLTGMPHQDALNLIDQEAHRKVVSLTEDEREQLWQRTGGVPLAVVWSIGLMGLGGSVESVLRRLSSGQSDIAKFCFEESVAQIRGRDAYWLLLALSLFATDASREALGIVAGLGEDTFGRDMGLEELLRLSLVNKSGDRFSLLPLTRSFVQNEVGLFLDWQLSAHQRLFEYYSRLADTFANTSREEGAVRVVEKDIPNILFVISQASDALPYLERDDGSQILDSTASQQADLLLVLISQTELACRFLGYWTDCVNLCLAALRIGRQTNATRKNARHCFVLSRISYHQGNFEESKRWAKEALDEAEKGKHEAYILQANRRIGLVALHQNDIETAERILTETLTRYQAAHVQITIAPFLAAMGELAEMQGDLMLAQTNFLKAIEASREDNDLPAVAHDLLNLGRVYFAAHDTVRAEECLLESLQIARTFEVIDITCRALLCLALLDKELERHDSAVSRIQQSLHLFRRLGLRKEQTEAEELLRQLNESA